jgi:hypothetical protein
VASDTTTEIAVANGAEIEIAASCAETEIAVASTTATEIAVASGAEIEIAASCAEIEIAASGAEIEIAASCAEIEIAVASAEGENLSYGGGPRRVITAVAGSGAPHSSSV